jgi:hypothetical protein
VQRGLQVFAKLLLQAAPARALVQKRQRQRVSSCQSITKAQMLIQNHNARKAHPAVDHSRTAGLQTAVVQNLVCHGSECSDVDRFHLSQLVKFQVGGRGLTDL